MRLTKKLKPMVTAPGDAVNSDAEFHICDAFISPE
jgi:hypothetical protein